MNRYSIAAGTVALCLALAACSSSGNAASSNATTATTPPNSPASSAPASSTTTGPSAPASATTSGIVIMNFGYSGTMTVKAGQTVTVTNMDSVAHTLTDKQTHEFDTGNIAAGGGTGTFVAPSAPGSYPFGCTYHPEMAGTLVVTG